MKRRDIFNDMKVEVEIQCELPCLDVGNQRSSMFDKLRKCFSTRRALGAVVCREEGLKEFIVSEAVWNVAEELRAFHEFAASATEH